MSSGTEMAYPRLLISSDKFNVIRTSTDDDDLPTPPALPENDSESLEARDIVLQLSTPFTSSSPIFEYPFPPYAAGSDPSLNSFSQPSRSNMISWPSLLRIESDTPPVGPPFTLSSSSIPTHSYPKLKIKLTLPTFPIPPSLMKKRPKWTLSILGKKKNTQGGATTQSDSIDRVLDGG
ncbi:hypothetical protein CPB83DRAFT_843363 [Crepidotus variabilis]|uniref:Uncharacterized protein n=1 Tax=Crepidotus variabilis TaxID=179855 RepID=A0A9P6EUQ1_9AGAR|nr:hypothetical protein CPB83DRAFT_843363 [Crepidotus variabilis]